ncbi:MAG TPA: hypothetical protein VLA36_15975 [Longimicrobiales bacterium]|nr:hypothetical protein [Longimicrobiales bacterium]
MSVRFSRARCAKTIVLVIAAVLAPPLSGQAVPTKLLVRVLAHDAKIIGSGVGGARVTVKDAHTGVVLASGIQEGGTGSTDVIMRAPWTRGATLFDVEGTGSWLTTLDLSEPTWVEVVAEGPLGFEQSVQRGSKTLLMVPGVDVVGEGLIVEVNGFTVVIESPEAEAGQAVEVRAKVTMLCGCPTEPGGLWDTHRFQVLARLVRGGRTVVEAPLAYAGETSTFGGVLAAPEPGDYELQVLALDPARANNGMARHTVKVLY